jgi:hypothetical protein
MVKEMLLYPDADETITFGNCMGDLDNIIESEVIKAKFDRKNKRFMLGFGMLFTYQNYIPSDKTIISQKQVDRLSYKEFDNVFLDMIKGLHLLPKYDINKDKAFMISPVRVTTDPLAIALRNYKRNLLKKGEYKIIHYPLDDTDQSDTVGTTICRTNLGAESSSGKILMWYKKDSVGSVFDLGADFMLKYYLDYLICPGKKRKFKLINPNDLKEDGYEKFLSSLMKNEG